MDFYLIVKPDLNNVGSHKVWNYRLGFWVNTVTNGCRYKATKSRGGTTSPRSCDNQLTRMVDQPQHEGAQIFLERYIRNDFYGKAFSQGLTFEDK